MQNSVGQIKKTLLLFVLFLFCWGAGLYGVLWVYYQMQTGSHERALVGKVEHSLFLQRKMVHTQFSMIISDLKFLAKEEVLMAYLADPTPKNLSIVNREYLTFSRNKHNFDQIRYLDERGMEIVRVNYNAGHPVAVSHDKLQSKHNRYYFKDAFKLSAGEIFISPFDLNVEHGQVEFPYRPMIRFATPVFDPQGKKRGLVLINYLGQDLLSYFLEINSGIIGETMLVNSDGYWLLHPDKSKEWGFVLPERKNISFARSFPEVWGEILPSFSGKVITAEGIYVYTTIAPLDYGLISSIGDVATPGEQQRNIPADEYFWKSVTFLSNDALAATNLELKSNLFGLGGMLFLFGVFALWPLAEMFVRRKLLRHQLIKMAHFDALTGLPNRTLFFDRFHQVLHLATRYERLCALLYIDLDGFKAINDSLGHDAGDELLVAAGARMKSCCRTSDTVARLGGDEFIVLLSEITVSDGATILAEQILQAFKQPFELSKGRAEVGTSIGISVFPEHGTTADQLLKSADRAMYVSKKRGKNKVTVADHV